MKNLKLIMLLLSAAAPFAQAGLPEIKLTPEWKAKIEKAAPAKPAATPKEERKALVFSLMTGYKHWCTPHTKAMVKILGEKSGAYTVVESDDIAMFEPDNIKQFDLVILNNTCSDRKKRNIFWDVTRDKQKAAALEKSLIDHIAAGNGLVSLHGAITVLNNSMAYSSMCGGSFDFHPKQQEITCTLVDPKHPMVEAFNGKPFVHYDEPYLFKNAYTEKNFRPLLEMDVEKIDAGKSKAKLNSDRRYVAWIKKHGEGRVFVCSPSHNAQSFEKPELLKFILNGIQYAAGDLKCDDSPINEAQ